MFQTVTAHTLSRRNLPPTGVQQRPKTKAINQHLAGACERYRSLSLSLSVDAGVVRCAEETIIPQEWLFGAGWRFDRRTDGAKMDEIWRQLPPKCAPLAVFRDLERCLVVGGMVLVSHTRRPPCRVTEDWDDRRQVTPFQFVVEFGSNKQKYVLLSIT